MTKKSEKNNYKPSIRRLARHAHNVQLNTIARRSNSHSMCDVGRYISIITTRCFRYIGQIFELRLSADKERKRYGADCGAESEKETRKCRPNFKLIENNGNTLRFID